jgi:hypothetical protein
MQKSITSDKAKKSLHAFNRRIGFVHCFLVILASAPIHAALIAGWDFQTTDSGGTAAAQQPNSPRVYNANFGNGTIYLDGTNGSSDWLVSNEIAGFAGTNVNAGSEFSTTTTGAAALALLGGSGSSANGNRIVFRFSMAGYEELDISLAAQRTLSGFSSQVWEYSADGTNYQMVGTLVSGFSSGTITGSFSGSGVLGFAPFGGLNNVDDAFVRVTFDGATSATGNNRLDNIRFSATEMKLIAAVPEPNCVGLGAVMLLVRACTRRSRHNHKPLASPVTLRAQSGY